jgi:hypothetical protein
VSAFGSIFDHMAAAGFPDVYFHIYTGLLGALFLAGVFVYVRRRALSRGIIPRRHLYRSIAEATMWITGVGLFFSLMRYIELPYMDMRLYSYLVLLLAILYAGRLTYTLSERYPLQRFQFDQLEANKRYKTPSNRRQPVTTTASGRSSIQRGKRRR